MSTTETESYWQTAFPEKERPELYLGDEYDEDGFRRLNDPQNFISDISGLSHLQLYALSLNNQLALKEAQQEYLEIAKEIASAKGKESIKNPQQPKDSDVFEETKAAALYGYKLEAHKPILFQNGIPGLRSADDVTDQEKHDIRFAQEPFQQGGFVPTDRQYKAMVNKAKDRKNVDGWKPVEKNGKHYIPMQQTHNDEYTINYVRRKINEDGELIQSDSAGSEGSVATPSKAVNKRLTRTRFGGKKVPPTRDVSEAPSVASTPGRKRRGTPATVAEDREITPVSKRQKVNGTDKVEKPEKPRHHNQYTKAKELAAQAALRASVGGARDPSAPNPLWSQLSAKEMRERKWNDEELVNAIKQDHSWLHDDPNKASDWKDKIINGTNPVRSYSMLMKWAYWKVENKDKRPRGKKDGLEKEKEDSMKGARMSAKRKLENDSDGRFSETPMPESLMNETRSHDSLDTNSQTLGLDLSRTPEIRSVTPNLEPPASDTASFVSNESTSRPQRQRRSGLGVSALVNYGDDGHRAGYPHWHGSWNQNGESAVDMQRSRSEPGNSHGQERPSPRNGRRMRQSNIGNPI